MYRTLIAAALAATALSGPALANSQLAASLGVAPGALSVNQLVELQHAVEENDRITERFIRAQANGAPVSNTGTFSSRSSGFTLNDAVELQHAVEEDDKATARFIEARANGEIVSGVSNSDALAISLGVAPGALSANELVELAHAIEDNDRVTERFIRGKAN